VRRALPALVAAAFVLAFGGVAHAATVPPPPGTGPVRVQIGLYLRNLAHLDEHDESASVVGDIYAKWKDPRLAYTPAGPKERDRIVDADKIWTPLVEIANGKSPHETGEVFVTVAPDGTVKYAERFSADASVNLGLRRFPFDTQALDLVLQSFVYDTSRVVFVPDNHLTGHSDDAYTPLAEWKILGSASRTTIGRFGPNGQDFSRFVFTLHLKRHAGFYTWKIFFPLFLITALAWAALWMAFAEFESQIAVGITSLLSAVAYSFVINTDLPKVSYVTFTDGFLFLCYASVFATILAVVALHVTYEKGRTELALRYQTTARWLAPLLFVVGLGFVVIAAR
jgi:hypothetical protein